MRILALLVLIGATCVHASPTPAAPFTARERAQGFRDHVILARPKAHLRATIDQHEQRDRVRVREKFARFGDLRVISLDDSDAADRAIARLRASGRYEFVERDRLRRAAATPNDPGFTQLWSLNNTGQSGGVVGADIRAVAAWEILREAPGVIVAVLDSGVNIRHDDITANLWRNPAPTFGDVHGASFINGVRTNDPSDVQGHGTHCAGIIGATGNNNVAMTGVAWRVQIMAVRVMTAEGLIASSDFAAGLDYAIGHGAHIINVSLFTDTHSQADLAMVQAARAAGVILVVAAGNEAANVDTSPRYYPDSYPVDNIITVGASTRTETLASFSNYGAAVDLVAPGSSILSLFFGNNTGGITLSGTSMAAPHVAGAMALIKARFPTDTYRQLINRLHRSVDVLPAYAGKAVTGGRLNLLKALSSTDNRPFNDQFSARARVVGPDLTLRTNNVGAESESSEPAHAGLSASGTLWWEWIAPSSGTFSVDTGGSAYDTVLAVYTGTSLDTLVPVAANDNEGDATTSRVTFSTEAGRSYQIVVGGKNGASGATHVALGSPPPNDAFASAAPLTGESTQVTGRNVLAGREPGEPRLLGSPGGASVWYRWTAPRSGRFQISVASTNFFDPLLAVYTGAAFDSLRLVVASDNIGPGSENVDALCPLTAVAGTTYFISVESKHLPNTGEFTLSVTDAIWQAPTLRVVNGAPAIGSDGTIYIGSTDFNFYAFRPDGALQWRRAAQDAMALTAPAVGDDGTVYFYSLDGTLSALRPDGTLRWRRDFGVTPSLITNVVASSPAVGLGGVIYLKAGDGYLHAIDPDTGGTRWRFNVNAAASNASPVIATDGTVYQGSSDNQLYAVNPDGTRRWSFDAREPIQVAPALDAGGNLYFTGATTGRLFCVTPSGLSRWTYTGATAGSTSSPALSVDGATVYFGAKDKRLHAVHTATGTERWRFTLGGEVGDSSPAVDANGVIYVGCRDRKLYAVRADGTLKRTYDTGGPIDSSPALWGTTLYVGSDDAKLYAWDLGVGPAPGPWPQFRNNARRQGRAEADLPVIAAHPSVRTVPVGSPLSLNVDVGGGTPFVYQWFKNGVALPAGTTATYTVANTTPADAGAYYVSARNAFSTVQSTIVSVTVVPPGPVANVSRLVNLSILTQVSAPQEVFTVGAVVGGAATAGAKPILIRAVGPSLAAFGVDDPLSDPSLEWYTGSRRTAANDNWGGASALSTAFAQVGAFPLAAANSRDAALHAADVWAGNYSVRITGQGGARGTVIAEIYDATPALAFTTTTPRLINLSVLKEIGSGLTAGFVIGGSGSTTVLIRAIGPTLSAFGVGDALADPRLQVFSSAAASVALNDNWGGTTSLAAAFTRVGAFALDAASRDAAVLATLAPGSYTVQVAGPPGAAGSVLVEIYEVP